MDRLLARLERTFLGRIAIENLTNYLVGGMAIVFVLSLARPALVGALTLEPSLVLHQPWRLVTFLFVPPPSSIIWVVIELLFLHFVGSSLEANWGAFKYNVYYFVGACATIAAAFLTGGGDGNWYLNESLLFAVATLAPNVEILFFVFPMKLKWLALLTAALIGYQLVQGDMGTRVAIAAGMANYFLFFTGDLVALFRGKKLLVQQARRRASSSPPPPPRPAARTSGRACAICGARQDDGADIRVCSCEKCGKARELCLEHARNH